MKKLLFMLIPLLFLCGCQSQKQTQTAYYFDTVVTLTLPADADHDLFDKAWDLCEQYDLLFDRFSADSDLGRLLPGTPTVVSEDTAAIITMALELNAATDGAFDIRLGAISDLWRFETDTLPQPETLLQAVAAAQASSVTVEGNRVTVTGGAKLDLGGIAKGYVTDRLAELFREEGCSSAIINLGGNVYCLGNKDGHPFSVGIDLLMDREDPPILSLTDQAAVTAGVTQRYKMVDGVRYHHILDPQSGMPARTGLLSVTVIADSATLADVLSTACIVLGQEKAEELLKQFPGVSAVLVTEDQAVYPLQNPPFVQN